MASTLIASRENCAHKMQNIHVSSSFYLCDSISIFRAYEFLRELCMLLRTRRAVQPPDLTVERKGA